MTTEPQFEDRDAQLYVGIRRTTTMETFPQTIDAGWPVVFGWLAEQDVPWAGAPFIRYVVIDMAGALEIELGIPVAAGVAGDARVPADALPAGRYVVVHHTGLDGLLDAHTSLQKWAEDHNVAFDMDQTEVGEAWRSRTEHYLTNPADEPDASKWDVEIAYLTAG